MLLPSVFMFLPCGPGRSHNARDHVTQRETQRETQERHWEAERETKIDIERQRRTLRHTQGDTVRETGGHRETH